MGHVRSNTMRSIYVRGGARMVAMHLSDLGGE
jgi:hypothetical protein